MTSHDKTIGQWAEAAEIAWQAYRAYVASGLRESRQQLIRSGVLSEFERSRRTTAAKGQAKAPIVDEKTAYVWAVVYFFAAQLAEPLTWAALADMELRLRKLKGSPPERARMKRKLAEQVRTHVSTVLRALKLPE